MALVRALSEQCKDGGKYVHYGATSYDIVDTAMALTVSDALFLIKKDLFGLLEALADGAEEHRDLVCVGRTHGQFALPMTFGLKLAVYTDEVMRHLERLEETTPRVAVGKMAGAVGTSAGFGPKAGHIRKKMSRDLGIVFEEATTQIVQRDRQIELVSLLANISTSLEKFATEIRNLQRSEIAEVSEGFDASKQVGSSTMAQKKNPVTCENVCGLARTLRGFMLPTWENAIQWHERDLANSASERFIIPHVLILADEMIVKMTGVFENLVVNKEAMERNLEATMGMIMAEAVMLALVNKGIMGRQEAHELVRKASMEAKKKGLDLRTVLSKKKKISDVFSERDLFNLFQPKNYLGDSKKVVDRTVKKARSVL
jgi:adenylosuccinate lyase